MTNPTEHERVLCNVFIEAHPVDALQILENLPTENTAAFIDTVSGTAAAALISGMNLMAAAEVLAALGRKQQETVCRELPAQIVTSLLRRLDQQKRSLVLGALPGDLSREMEELLGYDAKTAGAIMKTKILVLSTDISAAAALDLLSQRPDQIFDYIYVLDRSQVLLGYLKVRDLYLAAPERRVAEVMRPASNRLRPEMRIGVVLDHPGWARAHALPVVNEEGVFLGAISHITIREMEQQMMERLPRFSTHDAGKALGELYWLGMSAILRGAAAAVESKEKVDKTVVERGDR